MTESNYCVESAVKFQLIKCLKAC